MIMTQLPIDTCYQQSNTKPPFQSLKKKITAALETIGLLQGSHSPFLCSYQDVWELAQRSEKLHAKKGLHY